MTIKMGLWIRIQEGKNYKKIEKKQKGSRLKKLRVFSYKKLGVFLIKNYCFFSSKTSVGSLSNPDPDSINIDPKHWGCN